MKEIGETIREISKEHRRLLFLMIGLLALSLGLLVFSLFTLKVSNTTVHTGYADIGSYQGGEWGEMQGSSGYVSGRWMEMLTFPILAVIIGLMHNLIAVKLYKRRGPATAGVFIGMSMVVVLGAILVLLRLLGEG